MLGGVCTGRPHKHSMAEWRRRRLMQGSHPKDGSVLGVPRRIDPAVETFAIVLGDSAGSPDKCLEEHP